jgi:hypothetical protein
MPEVQATGTSATSSVTEASSTAKTLKAEIKAQAPSHGTTTAATSSAPQSLSTRVIPATTTITPAPTPVTDIATSSPIVQNLNEVVSLRTLTSKTFSSTTPGVFETRLYSSPIHYLDPNTNTLQDIDTTLVPSADGWTMSKAPYTAAVSSSLGDDFFTFTNGGQSLAFSPAGSWGSAIASSTPVSAQETTSAGPAQNKEVRWGNALGSGIDLNVLLDTDKVVKNIVINSLV